MKKKEIINQKNNFNNLFKILLILSLFTLVLTWFIPSGSLTTTGLAESVGGKLNFVHYFLGWINSVNIFFIDICYILCVGALYGVLNKIKSYHKLTDNISKKVSKHKGISLILISLIFTVLSTTTINIIPIILFIPFVVSILVKSKIDKRSIFLSTFASIMIGIIGPTFTGYGFDDLYATLKINPADYLMNNIVISLITFVVVNFFSITKANDKKDQQLLEDHFIEEGITEKTSNIPMLLTIDIFISIFISFIISYYILTKVNTVLVFGITSLIVTLGTVIFANYKKISKKEKSWPFVVGLSLITLLIVLGFTNWGSIYNFEVFTDFNNWLTIDLSIKSGETITPLFSYILGSVQMFGKWEVFYGIMTLITFTILIAKSYCLKYEEIIKYSLEGMKKILFPALIFAFAHVLTSQTDMLQLVNGLVYNISTITTGYSIAIIMIMGLVISLFCNDPRFITSLFATYLLATYQTSVGNAAFIINTMFGFMQFIAPTSILLFMGLNYCNINYKDYLKFSWKMLLSIFLMTILIFVML